MQCNSFFDFVFCQSCIYFFVVVRLYFSFVYDKLSFLHSLFFNGHSCFFFAVALFRTIFIFIGLENHRVMTFDYVFNVNHAGVANNYNNFVDEFLNFTLFTKMFVYKFIMLIKFLPMFAFIVLSYSGLNHNNFRFLFLPYWM